MSMSQERIASLRAAAAACAHQGDGWAACVLEALEELAYTRAEATRLREERDHYRELALGPIWGGPIDPERKVL